MSLCFKSFLFPVFAGRLCAAAMFSLLSLESAIVFALQHTTQNRNYKDILPLFKFPQ